MKRDDRAIIDFLIEAKKTLSRKDLVTFAPRRINTVELIRLGLQVSDVFRIIGKLEPRHWHAGPEPNQNGSEGKVAVFFYPYGSELLYIKLKLTHVGTESRLCVLSFHEEGLHG